MQNQPKNSEEQWTILKLLNWTTSYFQSHQIDSPRAAAEILLAHTLEVKRIDLYLRYDQPLCRSELNRFRALIKRRINREPVAYIVGHKEFWSLDLVVTPDVLIPRPETECLVESVLALDRGGTPATAEHILELGTGSGAIVLALASERAANIFYASDRSTSALAVAQENARRLGLADRIHFFAGDWFDPLKNGGRSFDVIVSNPPYVAQGVMQQLQPEIQRFEPLQALDGDRDGLKSIRHIIEQAHRYLVPSGYLVLEIGHDQKKAVQEIVAACRGYDHVNCTQDYGGYDRVVAARRKGDSRQPQ
jgi:release factor glutamine methyltransferase